MASDWKIELKNTRETSAALMKVARDLTGEPMLEAMRDSTLYVTADARRNAPVNTGILRASIVPEVKRGPMPDTVQGIVGSNKAYAPYMELGTKPHFPPIAPIARWVHLKQIAGIYSIKTHRRMGSTATQAAQDKSVAYLIARAIARKGTKARRYLLRAFLQNRDRIYRRLNRAVGDIVR